MLKRALKAGERIVKGMEHMGPVPEDIALDWEDAIARGTLRTGVPDFGMSAFLNGQGDAAAIATMGIHSLPKKKNELDWS